MIAALLLLFTATEDKIQLKVSSPSTVVCRVEFSEMKRKEMQPIARFIISGTKPTYGYLTSEIDSSIPIQERVDEEPIQIGGPVIIGGVTLYTIAIQSHYIKNKVEHFVRSAEIKVDITPPSKQLQLSPSMSRVFRELILNYQGANNLKPSGFLIITPDAFVDEIQPLARWKERKGWNVEIRTLTQTGNTPTLIKDYIANAYNTWSPRPEYVLLIGDVTGTYFLPAAAVTTPVGHTDYPYTLIEGNDFFAELLIGRLPAASESELSTMVAKIIGYETEPYLSETSWFTRSLMVAANAPGFMTTPIPTKRWIRDRFLSNGFGEVDTVYYPPTASGAPITNSVNQGVLFVNYRAGDANWGEWIWPSFDLNAVFALNNGWKLPIVTSITCLTGNFQGDPCLGEAWLRAGNPVTPKGAVAFIGASAASTSSRWNNCLDYGIYWAILEENISSLGSALYRGKMEVYTNFPDDTTWLQGSSFYFHTYNLLGDPSLSIWTNVPDTFLTVYDSSMPVGASFFSITVTNSANQPVEDAMVSLHKAGEVKEVDFTDASGYVDFNFATSTQDTLFVTVTKQNYKPYQGFCLVNNSSVYVDHFSHTIDDAGGNNNGDVNPGETIELGVTLKNYGNSTTATNVSVRLSTIDPLVSVTDSIKTYGSINPGATATASPFVFNVSTNAKNGHVLKFNLNVTSSQGNWTGSVWIDAKAPEFAYQRHQVLDGGNGYLEPGETSDFIISLQNTGQLIGNNITGILRSINPGVIVTDSAGSFGNIPIGDSATNNGNRFTLSAVNSISPGYELGLSAILSGDNDFRDTLEFELTLGPENTTKPFGPDDYGYFAYDDTDTGYDEKPGYNWFEVDPNHGGPGDSLILENDETITMSLPFSFKYYGDWYDQVSISSNGYIAMGATWVADMYNWAIPAAGGPPLLIAPFWDDLDPTFTDSSGNVSYWHDDTNHCLIIEYSRMQHVHDPTNPTPGELQTFEVVLFDPQYYPTQTGDGEILFQYMEITNDDVWHNYATVGIENYEHTTGLEYTFANSYPNAAAPLANNRAIKFTTDPPDTFYGIREYKNSVATGCRLDISPNPFSRITDIRYLISDDGYQKPELKIYDISGRLVKSFQLPTSHLLSSNLVSWDGTDNVGNRVPAGIYFVRLQGIQLPLVEKVILVE
jgi:hypothetical protein